MVDTCEPRKISATIATMGMTAKSPAAMAIRRQHPRDRPPPGGGWTQPLGGASGASGAGGVGVGADPSFGAIPGSPGVLDSGGAYGSVGESAGGSGSDGVP
jgi:hypothetical protein